MSIRHIGILNEVTPLNAIAALDLDILSTNFCFL